MRISTIIKALLITSVVFVKIVSNAEATAILDINVSGNLIGARNVTVEGLLYNVKFVEGDCLTLFDGCNEQSDFTFQSLDSSLAAAQALFDQVFLDIAAGKEFDTQPTLTFGCPGDVFLCISFIPYAIIIHPTPSDLFFGTMVRNFQDEEQDTSFGENGFSITFSTVGDTLTARKANFAVFSRVPEPGALALFGIGIVGLGVMRRRSAQRN